MATAMVAPGGLPAGIDAQRARFRRLARILAGPEFGRRVITISSRGRGLSDRDPQPERYTIPVEAGDVIAVLDHSGSKRPLFIGTSRGGLVLHVLAMTHLQRIERLVC